MFIIGHARSATSLLHRLMCGDDRTFSWVMMYEMLLPSILQRELVRGIARQDARWFGARLATRLHAWEDRVFAKGRQMHPMNLDGPEEDEFLLTLTFCSATVAMIFPYIGALDSPMFSCKVRALLEVFPDARFVVMMRNPCETIPGILKEFRWPSPEAIVRDRPSPAF